MILKDKEKIIVEVESRTMENVLSRADNGGESYLDNLIHEVFYYETRRVDHAPYAVNRAQDRKWLKELRHRFQNASDQEKKAIISEIIDRHVNEVAGHFSEPVYRFATTIMPVGLGVMLNALSPLKLARSFPKLPDVSNNIVLQGQIKKLQKLKKLGTIIMAPTHLSNLDSIILGYAVFKMGLPPVSYGAGINLFEHKLMGFFMHRLGAYKVDRLKRHSLYKEILKEYATATLEFGHDNLFFPGGTRSRSGAVERKLKLGLLGCGVNAYFNNVKNGRADDKIFIVPTTLNYQLVLEAENLIEDYLKEAGKSRYIIVDDEFSMPGKIYSFLANLVGLDARIYMTIGDALDPFGNHVDENGQSLDGCGNPIDIKSYLTYRGKPVKDADRDAEYTRQLGERVVESYLRDNVIFSSHVLAHTIFESIRAKRPETDFYRLLREVGYEVSIPMTEVYLSIDIAMKKIRALADAGHLRLSERLAGADARSIVGKGLKLFGSYHTRPALKRKGDRLFPTDMNLLYYYRNRLWGYGLEGTAE